MVTAGDGHAPLKREEPVDQKSDDSEIKISVRAGGKVAGILAITSDTSEGGWSYEDSENGNCDLVALIRREMVIAYQRFPRKRNRKSPYVRGVFVTSDDPEVNKILKMSEGHLHNEWKENPRDAGSPDVARFAKAVLDQIDKGVKEIRSKISSGSENDGVRIRAFDKLFAGKGPSVGRTRPTGPVTTVKRDFSIQNVSQVVRDYDVADPTMLRFSAIAKIALRPDHIKSHLTVSIDLGWGVYEESGPNRDSLLLDPESIIAPENFKWSEGKLVGILSKEPVVFEWSSRYFPNDWQVVPDPKVFGKGGEHS